MNKDRSIQIKLSLGYLLLISAAVFAIWYILNLTKELDKPQELILDENSKVLQIGTLISDFYLSEATSRVALITLDPKDINRYGLKMDSIKNQTLDIKNLIEDKDLKIKLDSIVTLLDLKTVAFNDLISTRKQYTQYASFDEALQKINNAKKKYKPTEENVIDVRQEEAPKDGFFKRISNAFSSKNEKEAERLREEQIQQTEKVKQESEQNLESYRKTSEDILNTALKQENKKLEKYLKQEEALVEKNIIFSNQIRELVEAVERLANFNSKNIFDETNNKIEKVTKNLMRFGGITLMVILILALILIDDINKNHKYKKNLEKSNKNLEEFITQKDFFIAAITHDMNAPLNTLFGFTELLENTVHNKKQKEYVQNIQHSASYFRNLVEDLSLFTKLERQFLELNNKNFNFKELINSIYQQQSTIASKKNLKFTCTIDENLNNNFISDPHRVTQILTNVISNAIKFTKEGSVEIIANYVKNGVVIKVIDTGIGIQIDNKNDLYKEFVQAHKGIEKVYGGTGLGLNISKRLIDLIGGAIDYDSKINEGTTFMIFLPLVIKPIEDSEPEKINENVDPKRKLINKNILVIDDDLLQLQLIKEILVDKVNSIDLISDGKQLNKYLNEKDYQLIISDLQMPNYTGYQIIKDIRKHSNYKETPVIAFSGKIDLNERELLEIGFNAILRKPLHLRNLLLMIYKQLKIEFNDDIEIIKTEFSNNEEYNISELLTLLENDKEAVKNILNTFIDSATADLQVMFDAYRSENKQTISQLAHKLLPMYRQLHMLQQIIILEKLEREIDLISDKKLKKMIYNLYISSEKIFKNIKKIELY